LHSLVIVQETNGRSEDHKPSKTPELVQLVGWSQKCDSFLLVYEYMPNGSLGYHLLRMHCVIWRNAAHPVVLPRPEDPLDLDENTLHNLDWNSIIKELGLHDDPGPTLKNVLQFNPCEPQVPHHLPELPHSQHFDPSQFAHRVTVVVPEEYVVESRLIKEKLSQFAQELKIGLQVDFVPFRTFEALSFKAVKFIDDRRPRCFYLRPSFAVSARTTASPLSLTISDGSKEGHCARERRDQAYQALQDPTLRSVSQAQRDYSLGRLFSEHMLLDARRPH
jgi:hypothetical protein